MIKADLKINDLQKLYATYCSPIGKGFLESDTESFLNDCKIPYFRFEFPHKRLSSSKLFKNYYYFIYTNDGVAVMPDDFVDFGGVNMHMKVQKLDSYEIDILQKKEKELNDEMTRLKDSIEQIGKRKEIEETLDNILFVLMGWMIGVDDGKVDSKTIKESFLESVFISKLLNNFREKIKTDDGLFELEVLSCSFEQSDKGDKFYINGDLKLIDHKNNESHVATVNLGTFDHKLF